MIVCVFFITTYTYLFLFIFFLFLPFRWHVEKIGIGENKIPRLENRAQAYPQDWIFNEHDVTLISFHFSPIVSKNNFRSWSP